MSVNVQRKSLYESELRVYRKGMERVCFFHKVMQVLYKRRMNEWGVLLSYMAAQFSIIMMADNKAYLESIARSFGYFFGRIKVRVNTISQSPTATKAGQC
jgi:enoyl-[acyl-carrier protein] reductase I